MSLGVVVVVVVVVVVERIVVTRNEIALVSSLSFLFLYFLAARVKTSSLFNKKRRR